MMFLTSGLLSMTWATSLLGLLLFVCARSGMWLLHVARISEFLIEDEQKLFGAGLGLTLLSLGILFLGMSGNLVLPAVLVLLLFFVIGAFLAGSRNKGFAKVPVWAIGLFFAVIFLSWLQALAPATGQDALAYHLEHAKQFVLRHAVVYLPDTRESLWPLQTEMLFSLGLLLQGATLAQLFHWMFYPLTAYGVFLLTRRLNEKAAPWAAIIFLMTPAAFAQSGQAYADLSLAFFTLLAVYPLLIDEESWQTRLAAISGFFAGAACGTKYLGLGCAAILWLLWALRSKFNLKTLFGFTFGAAAAGSIWYVRSWILLGNPVYPFFADFFGGHGYPTHIAENVGMGKGPLCFFLWLWNVTLYPVAFGGPLLGPLYLMFVPFLILLLPNLNRRGMLLGSFIFFYTLFLFTQSQQTRFFLSVAPLLAAAAAAGLHTVFKKNDVLKKTGACCLAVVFLSHIGIFSMRVKKVWPAVSGKVSAKDYLMAQDRSFPVYAYLQEHLKPGETFFNAGDARFFYGPSGASFDSISLRRRLAKNGQTISDFLDRRKFNYILVAQDTDKAIERHALERGYSLVLDREAFEKPAHYHYRLYYRTYQ